ncbi:MAG TPA: hypothetical protein VGI23_07185 [Steroidobacteraceae bacterium]
MQLQTLWMCLFEAEDANPLTAFLLLRALRVCLMLQYEAAVPGSTGSNSPIVACSVE